MNPKEQEEKVGRLIARCWADESFKQRLLADPMATLKAEDLKVRQGLEIKVLENTDKVFHLVIPKKSAELSDDNLNDVSGGRKAGKGQHEYLVIKLEEVFVSS